MRKIFLFMALCLTTVFAAKAATVDLSTLTTDYVAQNGDILTGTLAKNVKISIAADAKIILNGAKINADGTLSGDHAGITCLGNAEIEIAETNTINSLGDNYPGIQAPDMGTLKITSGIASGYLNVKGGAKAAGIGADFNGSCQHIEIAGGTIIAVGGQFAAGIGGANNATFGNIYIHGASVTATGGIGAAGIGGGYGAAGQSGNITIYSGKVIATGGDGAPGIGSGESSECLDITFNEAQVTATGGVNAPAIGSGVNGRCRDIIIGGNALKISATAGYGCSVSVGSSNTGFRGTVYVDGESRGDISANPWVYPEPWDGNLARLKENVVIENDMTIYGKLAKDVKISVYGGVKLTLDNVSINADSTLKTGAYAGIDCEGDVTMILKGTNIVRGHKDYYPGIAVSSGATLTIMEGEADASLEASGMMGGAGIGGGYGQAGGNVVIESGLITAIGGSMGAGIGGGFMATFGNITIEGGIVNAFGGTRAAAIGGGYKGNCGNITITDGVDKVTATKRNPTYTPNSVVGEGDEATCGTITIGGKTTTGKTENVYVYEPAKSIYAVYEGSSKTMTLYYDSKCTSRGGMTNWMDYDWRKEVTLVVLDESMKNARPTTTENWFESFYELTEIQHLDYLNTSEVTTMRSMFFNCKKLESPDISHFNTEKVEDMNAMFEYCFALTELDLTSFNTSKVKLMSYMFAFCTGLTSVDLRSFDISNVTSFAGMFWMCRELITIKCNANWSQTSANTNDMFGYCLKLTDYDASKTNGEYARPDYNYSIERKGYFYMDGFEVYAEWNEETTTLTLFAHYAEGRIFDWQKEPYRNATTVVLDESMKDIRPENTSYWFNGFRDLTKIEHLDYLNTSEVLDMGEMFTYCQRLKEIDLSHFNTEKVMRMVDLFYGCESLTELDLRTFKLTSIKDMSSMFCNCTRLKTIYCEDDWSQTEGNVSWMFMNCPSLVGGNGTTWDENKINAEYARLDKDGQKGYFSKKTETGMENVQGDKAQCTKVIIDGQLFIEREGQMYDVQGRKVK